MSRVVNEKVIDMIDKVMCRTKDQYKHANNRVARMDDDSITVYLYDNPIATIKKSDQGGYFIAFDACNWQTVTTKSRINAMADHFGVMGVYQRDYVWYFDDNAVFIDRFPQHSSIYNWR